MVTLRAGRRITLPRDVCDRVGFAPGNFLEIELTDNPDVVHIRKKDRGIRRTKKKPRALTAGQVASKE